MILGYRIDPETGFIAHNKNDKEQKGGKASVSDQSTAGSQSAGATNTAPKTMKITLTVNRVDIKIEEQSKIMFVWKIGKKMKMS